MGTNNIKTIKTNGFTNIHLCPINIDKETFQKQFILRCRDIYLQNLHCPDSNRFCDYLRVREISDDYGFQSYLKKVKIVEHRATLTRLRTGCTCLALDTGRFENIPEENQICPFCNSGVEDVPHFLFECKYKMKSKTDLEHTLGTISNKKYKHADTNGKLNILLNMKLEDIDLTKRISKASYQLYKE